MQKFESNGSKLALAYVKNVKCCAKCGKCRVHVLVTRHCVICDCVVCIFTEKVRKSAVRHSIVAKQVQEVQHACRTE